MKVGEYVRNKYGIAKVIDIENNNGIDILVFDKPICFLINKKTGEIKEDRLLNRLAIIDGVDVSKIKSNPKIIKLIGAGDYVNGRKVYQVGYNFQDDLVLKMSIDKNGNPDNHDDFIYEDEIETIVTKEQFEAIKYEIK